MGFNKVFVSVLLLLLISGYGCHSVKPYYNRANRGWQFQTPDVQAGINHQVYMIGDMGKVGSKASERVVKMLRAQREADGGKGTVLVLGDNLYPSGMVALDDPKRSAYEAHLAKFMATFRDIPGQGFVLPGNHDWNDGKSGGKEVLKWQEDYVREYMGHDKAFYPKNACGDPEVIEVTDKLAIIIIDSQWYLHNWTWEKNMNEGCELQTRGEFAAKLTELVDANSDKNLIIATHHPPMSNGIHGGYFPIKDHFFPLTHLNKKYYLPLPVIGSLYPMMRYMGLSPQDIPHPLYQEYNQVLEDATFDHPDVIIASGHEHCMQHFQKNNKNYIVSGATSKYSYVRPGQDAEFVYGREGFSKVVYYEDGSVWMEMWAPDDKNPKGQLLYRKQLKEKIISTWEDLPNEYTAMPDSVADVAGPEYKAGPLKRLLLGNLYRNVWAATVNWPTLDLQNTRGNLVPIKRGGGNQTQNLRLGAGNNRQFVIRSVSKKPFSVFPDVRNSVVTYLDRNLVATTHPYAAMIIPPLASAAGVYHTNPVFYYVPTQPYLGDFADIFGNRLYLFEERPSEGQVDVASFGNAEDIISFTRLNLRLYDSPKHRVRQDAVLRARLFDMLIGDIDRGDDNWRWAAFEEGETTWYEPIPRDRDQAMLKVNGLLPFLGTRSWGARMFQNFGHEVPDVKGLNYNARWFDRFYLTEMDRDDWLDAASTMQLRISDADIREAVNRWPQPIYALNGDEIISKLISRRDNLSEFAERYYKFLAWEVDVLGTDQAEWFELTRQNEDELLLKMFSRKTNGEKGEKRYERLFKRSETKEVRIYGLGGDDYFDIKGKAKRGSRLRIIGGRGNDVLVDSSDVGGGKKTKVYDRTDGIKLQAGREVVNRTSNGSLVNRYDREAFRYNKWLPLIIPGVNVDDGFIIGLGVQSIRYGFRRKPYKQKQQIIASIASETQAVNFKYTHDFVNVFGKWDLFLDARVFTASHVRNFFGLGNNTGNEIRDDRDFNRLRYGQIFLYPALKQSFRDDLHRILFGPFFQNTNLEFTQGRFAADTLASGLTADDFDTKNYGGLLLKYQIDGTDSKLVPRRGFNLDASVAFFQNLLVSDENFFQLMGEVSYYYSLNFLSKTTLAMRVGGAANLGEYEIFQANTLGRRNNLRGFRAQRFAGDANFYHNTEARFDLFYWQNRILPMDVGLLSFFDHGRVWVEGETSNIWHYGYGGGLYLNFLKKVPLSVTYFFSDPRENFQRLEFNVGFFF
ncbi:MAG: BamA/TamA family outer membrane protein [Bacteroidota bacterium]